MADGVKLICFCVLFSGIFAIPGGYHEADVNDKDIQDIAHFAVDEIDGGTNSMFRSKMMNFVKVETQVVAGINYVMKFVIGETSCKKGSSKELSSCHVKDDRVRVCEATVWDQPWTKTRRLTDFSCHDKPSVSKSNSMPEHPNKKPSKHLLGGLTKLDHETDEAKAAASFAVEEMNAQTNSMYRLMIEDITSVHRQTVAGSKYTLMVKLGLSTCRNTEENKLATLETCPINADEETEMCRFEVLHQAWQTPPFQLIEFKCEKSGKSKAKHQKKHPRSNSTKKHVLGGDGHDVGNYGAFTDFMKKYNKKYTSKQEEKQKFRIFRANMKKAALLQQRERGSAKYGATIFADMSGDEFRKYYLTPKWNTSYDPFLKPAVIPAGPVPGAFDWREHGAVTPVKNQEQCGSCWAFSTTGNIEGQWFLRKSKLLSLSEQELVDCDKLDDGCGGGLPTNAYKEIIRIGGLETEGEYPYEAEDEKCKFKVADVRIYINSSVNISSNEEDMKAWLAKNGPISIGINAMAMQFYFGGVSHPWSFLCSPDSLDHGVLIVGYGVENGFFGESPYWIVKNSWGHGWGEKGYYRVYRGDGTCGVNKMPTSSIVD